MTTGRINQVFATRRHFCASAKSSLCCCCCCSNDKTPHTKQSPNCCCCLRREQRPQPTTFAMRPTIAPLGATVRSPSNNWWRSRNATTTTPPRQKPRSYFFANAPGQKPRANFLLPRTLFAILTKPLRFARCSMSAQQMSVGSRAVAVLSHAAVPAAARWRFWHTPQSLPNPTIRSTEPKPKSNHPFDREKPMSNRTIHAPLMGKQIIQSTAESQQIAVWRLLY